MNLLLTLYWHYGELCGSYAMRQFSLVHYRAQSFLLRIRNKQWWAEGLISTKKFSMTGSRCLHPFQWRWQIAQIFKAK